MSDDGWQSSDAGVAKARAAVELRRNAEQREIVNDVVFDDVLSQNLSEADLAVAEEVIGKHIGDVPDERYQEILKTAREGTEPESDPRVVLRLLTEIIGPIPTDKPEAIDAELAEMQKRMATDKTWHMDAKANMRYRALLRAKG